MLRRVSMVLATALLISACNNNKEESKTGDASTSSSESKKETTAGNSKPAGSATFTYTVDGVTNTINGSLLVQKDKSKLSPGNDYFAILTASGPDNFSINLNFLFAPKTGTYPVVGLSLNRTVNGEGQLFGPILGGQPKMTDYKVELTQAEDLGSNNQGGHRWMLSGKVTGDVVIKAMSVMRVDNKHPESVTVSNMSFSNLSFDDNWEELMEKGMEQLEKSGSLPKSN